jgi:transposase InsO family protein
MQMQGSGLTILEMCQATGVSRASYYRSWRKREPKQEEVALRDAIQRLALRDRHCGYRRISRWLKREGWVVNHKRVLRLMQDDNLLSIRRRRFVVTTGSAHPWQVYPNLARMMVLSAINQMWVADITYVRLQQEFIYLAVILDVYSRRVVGWSISRKLDSSVAQHALELALKQRQPQPGLIHHSDRGVQYACEAYVKRLQAAGITISMSRPGTPWDNAWAESFMKTLKVEEVDGGRYRNFDHATSMIGRFIDDMYNEQRLHSSLDYLSPVEFESEIAKNSAGVLISKKEEKRTKKEGRVRKRRPVETAAAEEIRKRSPSAICS